jgi:DNA-binding transcriptional LysR family regulator
MDLNAMAVFAKVAERGSFVGAAQALSMPTSTVSRRVAELELALGVRLLHRTTRSVRLTDEGAEFYARCARMVSEAREAVDALMAHQDQPRGRLRVSASSLFTQLVLGAVAAEALRRWPQLEIEIAASEERVSLVEEGFDLAIRAGAMPDSSLIGHRIGEAKRVVCASPGYAAERGLPGAPDELAHHRCILHPGRTWRFLGSQGRVEVPVTGPLAVNDVIAAREAAVAGVGVAWLPLVVCGRDIAAGRLVVAMPEWTERSVGAVWALHPGGGLAPPKVRAFVQLLIEHFDRAQRTLIEAK